ncbi:MAG TPA: magnesium chelatase, partial [Planctomycetota bacterium]|nr:magnesium chelatase [Planctomycetota bacterium]
MAPSAIKTVGDLQASGARVVSVKEEMRRNLIKLLKEEKPLFPGIIGYERTVVPAIQNALLAKHDFILLGLRGQGKSRILRALSGLLDEQVPVVPGCEINDHPLAPICKRCRRTVNDQTAIGWLSRGDRYREKLATPDVTMADLIGDIDPIKAANERRSLSDEEVIHYGILPRTHRGIFAINELPDLQTRIQVGLLNIMEERDVQIRGFPIRLSLDV